MPDHPNSWRRSFSKTEKELLKKIDSGNQVRREVARTVKAIFKRRYKHIPSYVIKTALFHCCDQYTGVEWTWNVEDYPYRVFDMLASLQGYLNEKWLPNYFLPNQNLLVKLGDKTLENTSAGIRCLLNSKKKVLNVLQSEGEL